MLKRINEEWLFHLLFWVLLVGSAMINVGWTRIFPDHGLLFIATTGILPIYANALWLIPRYLGRRRWLTYLLLLIVLLLLTNAAKALFFMGSFALAGEDFNFADQFYKWTFRDFRALHRFVLSHTALVLYLSFGYRLVKDWFVGENVGKRFAADQLSDELTSLKHQMNAYFSSHPYSLSATTESPVRVKSAESSTRFFFISTGHEQRKINYGDIRYLEGDGNYVTYHLRTEHVVVRSTIKATLAALPPDFIQIQRSYIVSLAAVSKIQGNHVYVGDTPLSIGASYRDNFTAKIKQLSLFRSE